MNPKYFIPLALEQLQKINGENILISDILGNILETGHVCTQRNFVSGEESYTKYCFDSFGKTWLAYSCPFEFNEKEWRAEWKRGKYPSGTHYLYCSKCGEINGKFSMFCPSCGRAMTPEAYTKIEKRLKEYNYE